jgi:hypothetical protein
MLSFGSAAFSERGEMIATYSANLELLPGTSPDARTAEFWQKNKGAYDATRTNLRPASEIMPEYVKWIEKLPGSPVFVGYPATFDFMFVYWYLIRFCGQSPFSHSALDMKTYASAVLRAPYRESVKRNMPKRWFSKRPHTHIALDDAIEQGLIFCAMRREHLGLAVDDEGQ